MLNRCEDNARRARTQVSSAAVQVRHPGRPSHAGSRWVNERIASPKGVRELGIIAVSRWSFFRRAKRELTAMTVHVIDTPDDPQLLLPGDRTAFC